MGGTRGMAAVLRAHRHSVHALPHRRFPVRRPELRALHAHAVAAMMTGLFQPVKKPVIRRLSSPGGDIGPQRPQYAPKTAPCTAACPGVGDISGWLTAVADAEANARTPGQALYSAWEKIA